MVRHELTTPRAPPRLQRDIPTSRSRLPPPCVPLGGAFRQKPVAECPYLPLPKSIGEVDDIVSRARLELEVERSHQPSRREVRRHQRAAAQQYALAMDRCIGGVGCRVESHSAVRIDPSDPGTLEPRRPVDREAVVDERM